MRSDLPSNETENEKEEAEAKACLCCNPFLIVYAYYVPLIFFIFQISRTMHKDIHEFSRQTMKKQEEFH
ncbi:hypothetical protein EXN66_Car008111 [Channa argus]|uniref:Transmembrane protein n=1 Tax=Channa argus TaxID=215402 RepID=A0A6G1PQ79_CHAAH|nr:hypothetical protein EXN66_Car008111 [Channa argus]